MSPSLTRVQALLLGTIVLLSLGLAVAALFLISAADGALTIAGWQVWGEKPFHVRAGFQEIQGVGPGTTVRIKGMDAGKVLRIESPAAPGEPVIVVLELHGSQRKLVRTDARVQIVSEG